MKISKNDMAARAIKAAQMAPSIEDRLRHARELTQDHPVDETNQIVKTENSLNINTENNTNNTIVKNGTRLEMIELDLIDPNPFNARKIYRTVRVSELAASIGTHGQEIPGVATLRNGRYVLAAGHYRLRALKLIGSKHMALMIRDNLSDKDLYAQSYRENAEREAQTTLDNALAWKELLDQRIYNSETEIAEVTGLSLPNVNKTLSTLRLSTEILDLVKEDPKIFALSVLYELVLFEAVAGKEKTILLAKQVQEKEIGRKEIQLARANIEIPKERKRKETSRQYKIESAGTKVGAIKEWDSGKVSLEIMLIDKTERAIFIEEIRKRFEIKN